MADDLTIFYRHQGDGELPAAAQGVDDELLGMALVFFVFECRCGQQCDGFDVFGLFVADGHAHGDLLFSPLADQADLLDLRQRQVQIKNAAPPGSAGDENRMLPSRYFVRQLTAAAPPWAALHLHTSTNEAWT